MKAYKDFKRAVKADREGWPETPCQSAPAIWFDHKQEHVAKKACLEFCPVVANCLTYALTHREEVGVWGGMSEKELYTLQRRFARTFHRKTWDDEVEAAFVRWVHKTLQDEQIKAVGVVTSKRRR